MFSELQDRLCGLQGKFRLVRCERCTLVFMSPRPNVARIGDYYPNDYIAFQPTQQTNRHFVMRFTQGFKGSILRLLSTPYRVRFGPEGPAELPFGRGRILDVGCGTGLLLQEFQKIGWEVYGVDPSESAARQARELLHSSNIYRGTLDDITFPRDFFEIVTMWHSLEHVHDPRRVLMTINQILTETGKLKIAVPNIESWEAKLLNKWWRGLEPPRHLYLFSPKTLTSLLESSGFQVARLRPQLFPSSVTDSIDYFIENLFHVEWRRPKQKLTLYLFYFPVVLSYLVGNVGCIEVDATKIAGGQLSK